MQILVNNHFLLEENFQISIFSDAVMYGYGVFDTLRTYEGRKTLNLNAHISRLINSSKQIELQLDYQFEEIKYMVEQVIERSKHELQRIKILAIPDYFIVISNELKIDKEIYNGVSLKTVVHKRSIPEIKSISYLDCALNYNKAVKQNYFDALFIDKQNFVYECTRSNIFWIYNGKLYTRQENVLPGIMREYIIKNSNLHVEYCDGKLFALLKANEVFITNSVIGVVPVLKINDKKILSGNPGKETLLLIKQFKHQFI